MVTKHFNLGDIVDVVRSGHPSSEPCDLKAALAAVNCDDVDDTSTTCPSEVALSPAQVSDHGSIDMEVARAGPTFITGLKLVLTRWVSEAEWRSFEIGCFHSNRAPGISICDYLTRLRDYYLCSDECFVIALVYIDRMNKTCPSMTVCGLTVHRLLSMALMVAAKFHDDVYYSNKYYAKVNGLGMKEVNALEAKMLKLLNWEMFVSEEEYELYHNLVCNAVYPSH